MRRSSSGPPSGYDAEYPFVEDLKRKDSYIMSKFPDREARSPDFAGRHLGTRRNATPLGLVW